MTAEQAKILGLFCYKFAELAAETLTAFVEKESIENQVSSSPLPIIQKGLMNRDEIAEFLGVSKRMIANLIKDGLPTVTLSKGRIQFNSEKVLAWAMNRQIKEHRKTKLRVVS